MHVLNGDYELTEMWSPEMNNSPNASPAGGLKDSSPGDVSARLAELQKLAEKDKDHLGRPTAFREPFSVAAREAVPWLLALVRQQQEQIDAVIDAVCRWSDSGPDGLSTFDAMRAVHDAIRTPGDPE